MHNKVEETYQPRLVEETVQGTWEERKAYQVTEDTSKPKYYACSMLPYPSGKLHMGHVRNYTINDMLVRWLRMRGFNVLMPMGWDAFGLPAENAAIKNKLSPAQWTYENIAYMKKQMQSIGLAIDWSREFATCDADYYRWNQWLFLQMLNKGIAYRKTQTVNWDPVDQTVLANEQVIDGKGWRTGALVEKREIPGYYLNITAYTEELLRNVSDPEATDFLSGWPERVRLMQENWLGKSQGLRFAFPHSITDTNGERIQDGKLYVFTTRADTIMGVTFCAVAPEHPLALHAAINKPEVAAFIEDCKQGGNTEAELATKEKLGLPLDLSVTHPLTGAEVPLWVGNYVLMAYGDGAVMGVPAHDERDFAFAQKYGLPIQQVLAPHPNLSTSSKANSDPIAFSDQVWAEWYADKQHGGCVNSGALNGLTHTEAVDEVAKMLTAKGLGEKQTTWRLRDWGISRQRYWGTPIPIVHCPDCGAVPEKEENLPVQLPQNLLPDGSGNPLNQCEAFLHTTCPQCGAAARRETDTMDTFVDSSWYFMRYCDAHDSKAMVGAGTQYWMQGGMDQYIGGIEHAILHLLYARFWTKVMRDLGLVKIGEPFKRLLTQGMVLNVIYSKATDNGGIEYFWPHDVEQVFDDTGKVVSAKLKNAVGLWPVGTPVRYDGIGTMSKSKNNGVDPQDLIQRYGADTARLYTMFTAPPEATLEWKDSAVDGSYRFLRRVWAFAHKHSNMVHSVCASELKPTDLRPQAKSVRRELHLVLKQVRFDYERMQYNTVVSGCMKMLNALENLPFDNSTGDQTVVCEGLSLLLRVLYPVTPHIATQLWQDLGYAAVLGDLLDASWPEENAQALEQDELDLVVQVNGKLRGNITVPAQANPTEIEALVLASPQLEKWTAQKPVKKIIVVPKRLVNIVA